MVLAYRQNYAALRHDPEASRAARVSEAVESASRLFGNGNHYNEERQFRLVRRINDFQKLSGMKHTLLADAISGEPALMSSLKNGRRLRGSAMGKIEAALLKLEKAKSWTRTDG